MNIRLLNNSYLCIMKNLIIYSLLLFSLAACNSSSRTQKLKADEFSSKFSEASNPILIDVRTPEEFEESHIESAINIDVKQDNFEEEIGKLDKGKSIFVYCKRGSRSAKAFLKIKEAGFNSVYELRGGIDSWTINGNQVVQGEKKEVKEEVSEIIDFATALEGDKLVLVDFMATWCGPCQKMKPSIKKLREELKDKITITEVDVDERKDLSAKFEIEAMPTLVFFKNGKETSRSVGYLTEQQLRDLIEAELKK